MLLPSPVLRRSLRGLAALAALLILAGCEASTAPAPKFDRPVQIQRVSFQNADSEREFVGVVRARYETDLGFRVAGKIVTRIVNVGDSVTVGDVVARLDPEDLRLQVQSAEAELTAATSNLAQAVADFERYSKLKANGWASVADFDRKKAASDEAQGRLDRAQRALDLARNQRTYADLKADADGVITATFAEPGQVVAIGQPVARLAHRGEKEAVVALPETWLAEARKSKAIVRLWADRDRSFDARLRELSPQADGATRTYAARFTIENADDAVAFGMTATVTLTQAVDAKIAKLPLSAILNRGTGPSVYLVDTSNTLILRPVTVASFAEDAALVTRGIAEGDKVVTLGVQKLEAGLKVRTVEAQ
ncbi:MAG: efflux RND transporter periplasmic adaptor subunit [Alphaproteobacteria bacterium]|nr:MAG: efflux RND transporter periplasmic adaptor subunit [Alphaproteobacteria bacterium]